MRTPAVTGVATSGDSTHRCVTANTPPGSRGASGARPPYHPMINRSSNTQAPIAYTALMTNDHDRPGVLADTLGRADASAARTAVQRLSSGERNGRGLGSFR